MKKSYFTWACYVYILSGFFFFKSYVLKFVSRTIHFPINKTKKSKTVHLDCKNAIKNGGYNVSVSKRNDALSDSRVTKLV